MIQELTNKIIILVVVGLIILGGVFYFQKGGGKGTGLTLSSQEVGDRIIKYINDNAPDVTASIASANEENGLYKFSLKVGENEFVSYATKDGKLLFPQAIDLEEKPPESTPEETPKAALPDVKLFVMSYCPYGLQAEKALLPAWQLLKDKANIGIYFVNYAMHEKQEIDENTRQYCIQKEQQDKFISYLDCFAKNGDAEKCLNETGIDKEKLNACISSADTEFNITKNYEDKNSWLNDQFPKFEIDSGLNEQYGVSGSPTLVINGNIVNPTSRSPEAFKNAICDAFETKPEECSQKLSEEAASSGFGAGTGNSSGGSCE